MAYRATTMTSVGCMDRYVTVEQTPAETPGGGFPVEAWTELGKIWMEKADVKVDERFRANQLSAAYETTWALSYRPDMDPDLVDVPKRRRLVYSGRTYDITSARPIGRKQQIVLTTLAK